MTDTDKHGRPEPPHSGDEAATLQGFLDYQRATLAWRCRGLSDEQLRLTLAPSPLTLGGMLSHLAYVEDYWFSTVVAEAPDPEPWASVDWKADPDWDWHLAATETGEALRALWEARVEASRAVVASALQEADALGRTHPAWGGSGQVSLRWVLTHMVEEYARHNGQADLIRESIDGETGE
ncbi:DinB family protein [Sporichthya sp.]|uniref:DinB family protein n=1 Tax=Sporichthya sp. TaxID=65475 RepID=UPI0017F6371F|nr:DinB family protein [Sporichthya sp.]MBA3742860.1 DinB family protein [Sporichthya sp.]